MRRAAAGDRRVIRQSLKGVMGDEDSVLKRCNKLFVVRDSFQIDPPPSAIKSVSFALDTSDRFASDMTEETAASSTSSYHIPHDYS